VKTRSLALFPSLGSDHNPAASAALCAGAVRQLGLCARLHAQCAPECRKLAHKLLY